MLSEALLRKLSRQGFLLVPTNISWRRAGQLEKRGWATIDPHYHRWLGRLDLTEAGREALRSLPKEKNDAR